jgi:hypothetical protein
MSANDLRAVQAELSRLFDELHHTQGIAAQGQLLARLRALLGQADELVLRAQREIQDRPPDSSCVPPPRMGTFRMLPESGRDASADARMANNARSLRAVPA